MAVTPDQKMVGQDAYWDKYAISRVTIGFIIQTLNMYVRNTITRGCVALISEAGEGKSQAVHQVARQTGYRVVDLRTAFFSLMSGGIPQKAEGGFFQIAVPDYMPKPGEKCILFFDEINQGQQHAIAMFFALLEDRLFFNYTLPKDCLIVCAMNPANAGYMVTKMETLKAFNRRLVKFYMYTPYGDWEKHAVTPAFHFSDGMVKPCHPWVLKYLNTNRPALYDKAAADKGQQFPCPATWQTVSRMLYALETEKNGMGAPMEMHSEFARALISGSIGTVHAKGLCDYIENNEIRISPEEILEKYKPKSGIRKKVMDLAKEPGGGVPDLSQTVASYLFDHKPSPELIAPCLALFWADLPEELAQGFYSQLSAAAADGDELVKKSNIDYMMALTKQLMNEEPYVEVNRRLHQSHDSFERKLKGREAVKDPMAA
jgi:hypothetical protein